MVLDREGEGEMIKEHGVIDRLVFTISILIASVAIGVMFIR